MSPFTPQQEARLREIVREQIAAAMRAADRRATLTGPETHAAWRAAMMTPQAVTAVALR